MKKETISYALEQIDDKYIEEAERYKGKSRKGSYIKWGVVAATFMLVVFGMLIFGNVLKIREPKHNQILTPPVSSLGRAVIGNSKGSFPKPTSQHPEPAGEDIIFVNEMQGFKEAARLYLPRELYKIEVWSKEAITAYFGKDLTPTYIPEDLQKSFLNGTAHVFICKDDRSIYYDATDLMFYSEFLSNGYPNHPINSNDKKIRGFTLTVSKLRIANYLYNIDENNFKLSKIGGIDVAIGHIEQRYGKFDPTTGENEKNYDLFYAKFELAEIKYELVAHNMELAEVVRIIESIVH